MKIKKTIVGFLFAFLLVSTANTQETRTTVPGAQLYFSGTTVTCQVIIPRPDSDDVISATIELSCEGQNIKTWNEYSTNGYLFFKDTVSVAKGKTYELMVDYTVNGKAQTSLYNSGTCK